MGALLRVPRVSTRSGRAVGPSAREEASSTEVPVLYRAIALGGPALEHDVRPGVTVSQPSDPEERQADELAEAVLHSAAPMAVSAPPLRSGGTGGQALDEAECDYFERRFGTRLDEVRIHDDATAAYNARALSANAFTIGTDISFAAGRYTPGNATGRRLLAHELSHVVLHGSRTPARIHRDGMGDLHLSEAIEQLKSDIVATAAYKALSKADREVADRIIATIAKRKPAEQVYPYTRLKQLFDTPVKSEATIANETQAETAIAVADEKVRVAKPAAKVATNLEEKAAADPKRGKRWVAIKGKFGGGTYFVDRASAKDIVVRAEILLIPQGKGTAADVNAIRGMEDGIEKAASTKGYLVDIAFVNTAGPDTFHVDVDPSKWEVATNWSGGDPVGFAHELHHMFAFELDRYNYIEAHSTNESMQVADRLTWFEMELTKPAGYNDPTSIMDSAPHPNASDVCTVAGLDEKTCVAARAGKKP